MTDVTEPSPVLYQVDGAVATITFNRPDRMNALDLATKEGLLAALQTAAGDDTVRAVVLTGTGRAFCVGQDLREHADNLLHGGDVSTTVRRHYNPITLAITTMAKPVLAAVNGVAAGAGAGFAFACDLRIAADTAAFNMAFAGVALNADSGTSWTLPNLVGRAKALELLLLPETIPVAKAAELGLVTEIVPAAELAGRAAALAAKLAAGPTVCYASLKESVAYSAAHSLPETLEFEDAMQTRCGQTKDHLEAVQAFLAKRPPEFLGA